MKVRNELDETDRHEFAPNSIESEKRQRSLFKGALLLLCLGLFALTVWSSARDDGTARGCERSGFAARTVCAENVQTETMPFPAKGGTAAMSLGNAGHPLR
jgi:hypothetical protein